MIPDFTPWDGIVPFIGDLWVAAGVGLYYLGKSRGRKRSTSLVLR